MSRPREEAREADAARIDREAAGWLVDESRGFTPEEQARFQRWLDADPRHAVRVADHRDTWRALRALALPVAEQDGEPDPDLFKREGGSLRRWAAGGAIVAALAAAIALVFVLPRPGSQRESGADAVASFDWDAAAMQRHFLPDGTLVELNAGAAARARLTATARTVRLIAGEAHFSIARDEDRPFFVEAGGAVFRAVGTAFHVRVGPDAVELLVTEGVVRIAETIPEAVATARGEAASSKVEVTAFQRVSVPLAEGRVDPTIETVRPEEIDRRLGWKHETLEFAATALAEAVAEFNRRNRDQIVLADEALHSREIDGAFRSDNLQGFVRMLELSAGVAVDRSEGGRIVIRAAGGAAR